MYKTSNLSENQDFKLGSLNFDHKEEHSLNPYSDIFIV